MIKTIIIFLLLFLHLTNQSWQYQIIACLCSSSSSLLNQQSPLFWHFCIEAIVIGDDDGVGCAVGAE
jgi:hypothetical protein